VIDLPKLYAIVDVEVCERAGWTPRRLAQAYLSGGARLLQLRAKDVQGAAFLALAEAMVRDARQAGARVIINDRADIAALSGADGVHVGQQDLAPADVRRVVGSTPLVGWSTHTPEQIESALTMPISYFAIGPIFATSTKATGYDHLGPEAVTRAAARSRHADLPVVAIGGITLATALRVIEAGATSVAVITDLVAADPEARVRDYLRALA
jgi:thiamine-phosphate pyrophosphorylase